MPLLVRLSRRLRVLCADVLRIEFAGHFYGGLADIEQGAAALLHEGARTLVEALGEFANGPHFIVQLVGASASQARHEVIDLCNGPVEALESAASLANDAVDRVALARQRRRIGLEI